MAKRISRRRLYAIDKKGISSGSFVPGGGISGSIVQQSIYRDGFEVITELAIDFAYGTTGSLAAPGNKNLVVGMTNSGSAVIGQINEQRNGVVTAAECICVESPNSGTSNPVDLDFVFADEYFTAFSGTLTNATALVAGGGDWVKGKNVTGDVDNNGGENKYIYITTGMGGNTGEGGADYTAGKFILRLFGYAVVADKGTKQL
jgi:hypothetical protein|tara:strand:+ start:7600 stop:8208 length:609 start_codon:yes stop_codon:yes gene_type:complete